MGNATLFMGWFGDMAKLSGILSDSVAPYASEDLVDRTWNAEEIIALHQMRFEVCVVEAASLFANSRVINGACAFPRAYLYRTHVNISALDNIVDELEVVLGGL